MWFIKRLVIGLPELPYQFIEHSWKSMMKNHMLLSDIRELQSMTTH